MDKKIGKSLRRCRKNSAGAFRNLRKKKNIKVI
jgi:hypothetical protein